MADQAWFNPQISFGHLLTAVSILVSATAVFIAWSHDRRLRRREQAESIRHSAGLTAAKLDRWVTISLIFFDRIQPIITDTDMKAAQNLDWVTVRDFLWRRLVEVRAEVVERRLDEELEMAYAALYGYDPKVRGLFVEGVKLLEAIDDAMYTSVLMGTQKVVMVQVANDTQVESAEVGNQLREVCQAIQTEFSGSLDQVVTAFAAEMMRLISATDRQITEKKLELRLPSVVFESELSAMTFEEVREKSPSSGESPVEETGKLGRDMWVEPNPK